MCLQKTPPMNVQLVKDDRDLAANVGEFLESAGHRVDYAADGVAARRLCSESRYDAIVLDVGLPGTSGLDVCRWLQLLTRPKPQAQLRVGRRN